MDRTVDILMGAVGSLLAMGVVLALSRFWTWASGGGLIVLLGGLTKADIETVKQDLANSISDARDSVSQSLGAIRSQLKSKEGEVPTTIEFHNGTEEPVGVYWVDYAGQERFYKRLEPNEDYIQDTFATHPWVVRTVSDHKRVAVVIGELEHQSIAF